MSERILQIINEIQKAKDILSQGQELTNIEIDLIKSKLRNAYDMTLSLDTPIEKFDTQKIDDEINDLINEQEKVIDNVLAEPEVVEENLEEQVVNQVEESQKEEVLEQVDEIIETQAPQEIQDKEILADRFQGKQKSLNDIISKYHTQKDIATRLKDNPISNIKSAIGLNDRFLIINEMFKGDAEYFNAFVDSLNEQESLDEAMAFMNQKLEWDENQEGFKKLVELVIRRFVS